VSPNDVWYVSLDGGAGVSMGLYELRRALAQGVIPLAAMVARPGEAWCRAGEVPELVAVASSHDARASGPASTALGFAGPSAGVPAASAGQDVVRSSQSTVFGMPSPASVPGYASHASPASSTSQRTVVGELSFAPEVHTAGPSFSHEASRTSNPQTPSVSNYYAEQAPNLPSTPSMHGASPSTVGPISAYAPIAPPPRSSVTQGAERSQRRGLDAMPGGKPVAIALIAVAAVGIALGVPVLGYRALLPTVDSKFTAGARTAKSAPELDRVASFHGMNFGQRLDGELPLGDAKSPPTWLYRITWRKGRVARFDRVNPAGVVTQSTTVEYGDGDARIERATNGYGVAVGETTISNEGLYSRNLRSGWRTVDLCAYIGRDYDAAGRVERERCLDADKRPVVRSDGCFVRRFTYAADGLVASSTCLDEALQPVVDANGLHKTVFRRDERGNVVEESYFDASDAPVGRISDGCARRRYAYDAGGSVVEQACLDASGATQRYAGRTDSATRMKRDQNGCMTELSWIGATTGQPESFVRQFRVDAQCSTLWSANRDGSTNPAGLVEHSTYDDKGQRIEQRCEVRSEPAQCPEFGQYAAGPRGSVRRWEYDDRGRQIRRRCYMPNGKPSMCDQAYPHESYEEYDDHGLQVATGFRDATGAPTTWLGVARKEFRYNGLGRLLDVHFENTSGDLINSHCGDASTHYVYDAKQRTVSIEQHDKKGALSGSFGCTVRYGDVPWPSGAARVIVLREPGKHTFNEFYAANGALLKRVDCSDSKSRCHD